MADPELYSGEGDMASAGARAYNGVWGQSPWSGGQGGEAPLKLKSFFHWNVQRRGYSRHFSCSVGVVDGDSGQGDYGLGRLGLVRCYFWPAYKSQLSRILTAK